MRKTILLLFILAIFNNCNQSFPRPLEQGMTSDSLPYDTISIEEIYIEDQNIRTKVDSIINKFGEPDLIKEYGGKFTPKEFLIDSESKRTIPDYMIEYVSYYYEGLRFEVWNKNATLSEIDFTKCDYKLYYNGFQISKNTKPKDLKKIFPNSYKWQKWGLSQYVVIKNINSEPISGNEITWIKMTSRKFPRYFIVEFAFMENSLQVIYFPRYE